MAQLSYSLSVLQRQTQQKDSAVIEVADRASAADDHLVDAAEDGHEVVAVAKGANTAAMTNWTVPTPPPLTLQLVGLL